MTKNKSGDPRISLALGILWIFACWWFFNSKIEDTFDELALMRGAQEVTGSLVAIHEYEQEDHRGHVYFSDVGVYSYRLPDGTEYKTTTRVPTGALTEQEVVEYLPNNPAVSRIKGDGPQSLIEWLWRKVGLGIILMGLIFSPGVHLAIKGVRGIKILRAPLV